MSEELKACPVEKIPNTVIGSLSPNGLYAVCRDCPNRRTPDIDAVLEALAVEVDDINDDVYSAVIARLIRSKKGKK